MKTLKDYDYKELLDHLTGQALVWLGQGKSMHDIMSLSSNIVLMWNDEKGKEKEDIGICLWKWVYLNNGTWRTSCGKTYSHYRENSVCSGCLKKAVESRKKG